MGEEWGATEPFPFFCDFQGPLADAVRKGRRAEFKAAYADFGDAIPDPLAARTFRSAALDWSARTQPAGSRRLALVRDLLTVRRQKLVPDLAGATFGSARREAQVLTANWSLDGGKTLTLITNLSPVASALPSPIRAGQPIWGGHPAETLAPWSVFWSIGEG
jgi:maltooligosyltrehalose trehalohydrolase